MSNAAENLMSLDIVPVRCPVCGEAQNTLDGGSDPIAPGARIGCMVCGHAFEAAEYLQLSIERRAELDSASIDPKARAN